MNQCIQISIGSRVKGNHNPLIFDLNASIKRIIWSKAIGTVEKVVGLHKWDIVFDYDTKVKTVSSRSLIIVEIDGGIPLCKEGDVDTDTNVSIDVRNIVIDIAQYHHWYSIPFQ